MKNIDQWKPTKYVQRRGCLSGSRDPAQVHLSSRLITDRVAKAYEEILPTHACGDLLDLGCGQVPLYSAYEANVKSVTCVDWPGSPHDVGHADILCDVNEPLPIESDLFDTVICSDVLEHLHSPSVTLAEISRVLRPGGKLILSVPFMYGLHEQPHDYHRYTRFAIENWCELHGLQSVQIQEVGGAGDVLCNVIAKLLSRIPIIGGLMSRVVQAAWSLLRSIGPIRRADQKTSGQFPIEYMAVLQKPNALTDANDG